MAMNAPAIDKFESSLRPGGLLLVNSSLVHEREYRDDIKVVKHGGRYTVTYHKHAAQLH